MLSDRAKSEIHALMEQYPDKRSAMMPALHIAQREYGWLPDEAIQELADLLGFTTTEVGSVASFYTMYARAKPGKHTILFCTDLPCALAGADAMFERIEHKLGCSRKKRGASEQGMQTSADGKITLHAAECLGGCDHAPVMLIDGKEHQQDLTDDKIDEILERLKNE